MEIPSWSALRALSTNRAIQSADVWAVVVPVTAKLLERVQDVVTVQVLGHQLSGAYRIGDNVGFAQARA